MVLAAPTLHYAMPWATRPWVPGRVVECWSIRGAPVLNQDGSAIETSYSGHNTHGSIELINDQWYVFYHRPPERFWFCPPAMVAPIKVEWDEKPVSEGGTVTIRAYNPYTADNSWTVRDSEGREYKGAEVTSEGFISTDSIPTDITPPVMHAILPMSILRRFMGYLGQPHAHRQCEERSCHRV